MTPPHRNPLRAVPTTYSEVNFRSRLEARWALTFDLLDWPWEYEPPMETPGWLPDFALKFQTPVLVEIKPCLTISELRREAEKIRFGGGKREVLMLGASPAIVINEPGYGIMGDECFGALLTGWDDLPDFRAYDVEDAALAFACSACKRPSFLAATQSYHCRVCGVNLHNGIGNDFLHRKFWDNAGNMMRKAS